MTHNVPSPFVLEYMLPFAGIPPNPGVLSDPMATVAIVDLVFVSMIHRASPVFLRGDADVRP